MKVLLTGANGQLGWELQRSVPAGITLVAMAADLLDITRAEQVQATVARLCPAVIVNGAAYTAVDKAESEPARAMAINGTGAGHLARAAQRQGCRMIQISTDYVFDGGKVSPYLPHDPTNPLSVYGVSKLAGERQVLEEAGERSLIVRTAWLYSAVGTNFVLTMLRLMASRASIGVVADQIGTPTWAGGLAATLWRVILEQPRLTGIVHWSDAGVASWYDFAMAIQRLALPLGLLKGQCQVVPITTADYPTAAKRPGCSLLDKGILIKHGILPEYWQHTLQRMLEQVLTMSRSS